MEKETGIVIKPADTKDLPAILKLQYMAYESEGRLVGDNKIPPLTQTLEELKSEFLDSIVLKAYFDGEVDEIIGSVRANTQGGITYIGRLMVSPGLQKKGIGTALLKKIEEITGAGRKELFTSSKSVDNIRLYQKSGYQIFKRESMNPNLEMVFLYKEL